MRSVAFGYGMTADCGAALMGACAAADADAQSATDFYRSRGLTLVIGDASGEYARHIGKHILGTPTVTPQNMPGSSPPDMVALATRWVMGE